MQARQVSVASVDFTVSRGQLLAALMVVASLNGLAARIIETVALGGWRYALVNTFNTSVIVFGAWVAACYLAFREDDGERIRRSDVVLAVVILGIVSLPFATLSWLSLFLVSAYVIATSRPRTPRRRSALILFAICVPMFWGPVLFNFAAPPLLRIDAFVVSALLGTERIGNLVAATDGIHRFQVWPACSSFHNISQAGLAWIALSQSVGRDFGVRDVLWCALAMGLAAAINLVRLALMGVYFDQFNTIHGPVGAEIAGGLTLTLIAFVCMLGLRRELFARA